MANELVGSWGPGDLTNDTDAGYDPKMRVVLRAGGIPAIPMPKLGDAYNVVAQLPANYSPTTGFRLKLLVVDDGKRPSDLGKVAVFGAFVKRLVAGESVDTTVNAGTEVTANVTLSATAGNVAEAVVNIVTASMDSAVAADHIVIQLRRVGGASDTCVGPVLLLRASASAY